jgi:hypothetical protein
MQNPVRVLDHIAASAASLDERGHDLADEDLVAGRLADLVADFEHAVVVLHYQPPVVGFSHSRLRSLSALSIAQPYIHLRVHGGVTKAFGMPIMAWRIDDGVGRCMCRPQPLRSAPRSPTRLDGRPGRPDRARRRGPVDASGATITAQCAASGLPAAEGRGRVRFMRAPTRHRQRRDRRGLCAINARAASGSSSASPASTLRDRDGTPRPGRRDAPSAHMAVSVGEGAPGSDLTVSDRPCPARAVSRSECS